VLLRDLTLGYTSVLTMHHILFCQPYTVPTGHRQGRIGQCA